MTGIAWVRRAGRALAMALLVVSLLQSGPAAAASGQGLPREFAAALQRAGVKPQQISVWFGESTATEARFHWLPETPRNPASVLKVVTTAQALAQLGPGYRWTTRIWAEGPVRDGTLEGRLVLEGGGDPKLRREDLRALLEQVASSGIRRVKGPLVVDRGRFTVPPHDPGAFDGDAQRAYNVGADAALLNFAALSVNARANPDGTVQTWLEPPLDGVELASKLVANGGDCGAWRLRPLMRTEPARPVADGGKVKVTLQGAMPGNCEDASIDIAPLEAREFGRRLLIQTLREVHLDVSGGVVEGRAGYGMRKVGEWPSAPLADQLRDINRFSNNVMAEQVWLTAGGEVQGWPATREKATAATAAWLRNIGAWDEGTVVDSGSGLSRRTRVTAEQLHAVLRQVAQSPYLAEFASSLPIAGQDGTAKKTLTKAHARLKTGSLDGVRAAAGYVRDRNGRWLSLVVLLEGAPADGWRELLAWITDWAAATDGPVP